MSRSCLAVDRCVTSGANQFLAVVQEGKHYTRETLDGIVGILPRGEESELLEEIVRMREQPTINASLQVVGGEPLSPEELLLLKRAFGDCSAVKLVKQSTGSAKVSARSLAC